MDIDRDSRTPAAPRSQQLGGAFAPMVRADGMVLGAASGSGGGRAGFRRENTPAVEAPESDVFPPELQRLIAARESNSRDQAWDAFLEKHSRLLLHVARRIMPASDGAMDAYANILERLRRDDCRALLAYSPDGRSRFSTWLVVVARRMCVDFYRQRYGRPRSELPSTLAGIEREARRRLESFIGVEEADVQIPDVHAGPEGALRSQELRGALDLAVRGLPPEDQLLLKLRFHDEMSAPQIASVLSLPSPFHVYRRLKSVCAELRRVLQAAGVEDSTP